MTVLPPPGFIHIRLGFDNRHRYWNCWLERWVLPPIGVPTIDNVLVQ